MEKHPPVTENPPQQSLKKEFEDVWREVVDRIHKRRESREIKEFVRKPLSPQGGEYLEEEVVGYRP